MEQKTGLSGELRLGSPHADPHWECRNRTNRLTPTIEFLNFFSGNPAKGSIGSTIANAVLAAPLGEIYVLQHLFFYANGEPIRRLYQVHHHWHRTLKRLAIRYRRPYTARHSCVSWDFATVAGHCHG
jgi:hypothetical protein